MLKECPGGHSRGSSTPEKGDLDVDAGKQVFDTRHFEKPGDTVQGEKAKINLSVM